MSLDTKLISAIRGENYDAWSEPDDRERLNRFTDDPQLRYVITKPWRRVIAWDLGKLRDPNAMVVFKWRTIETGWGFAKFDRHRPENVFVTPVYQVSGVRESHDDYSVEVQRLRTMIESGKLERGTLVFDATGVGVAVEEQVRHIPGFEKIVPLTITSGDDMKTAGRFAVAGKSRLLSELEQVVKQRRIRIPEKQSTERLNRQLKGFQVEETVQGYYRAVDDRREGHHHDLLMSLAMGISYVEYGNATKRRIRIVS